MNFRAAIYHNNTLVATGLSQILIDMFNFRADILEEINIDSNPDCYDLIVIGADIYATHYQHFSTKAHKIIIVTSVHNTLTNSNIIDEFWSKDVIISRISEILAKQNALKTSHNELSNRELQVLQLVVKGHINKEIAEILNISFNTVLTHRKNITAKLGIKSISGLSVYAMMNGLISEA